MKEGENSLSRSFPPVHARTCDLEHLGRICPSTDPLTPIDFTQATILAEGCVPLEVAREAPPSAECKSFPHVLDEFPLPRPLHWHRLMPTSHWMATIPRSSIGNLCSGCCGCCGPTWPSYLANHRLCRKKERRSQTSSWAPRSLFQREFEEVIMVATAIG